MAARSSATRLVPRHGRARDVLPRPWDARAPDRHKQARTAMGAAGLDQRRPSNGRATRRRGEGEKDVTVGRMPHGANAALVPRPRYAQPTSVNPANAPYSQVMRPCLFLVFGLLSWHRPGVSL